jgi:hypothetical protein
MSTDFDFTPRSYSHKFPGGFRCKFDIGITDTTMTWEPKNPPADVRWLREYHRWRDRCLKDFADHSGVWHVIYKDAVHLGFRLRKSHMHPEVAYPVTKAILDEVKNAKDARESTPGVREQIIQQYEAQLLDCAPRSAGGSA